MAATVKALRDLGRLEPVDEALVAAARSLAKAVDANPRSPGLWHEFLQAVERLSSVGAGEKETDAFAALLADLSAAVGDSSET